MKYLATALACYACTHYLVGLLIHGRVAEMAEGLRHRPDAPTPGEFLRETQPYARRAHRQYSLVVGTAAAVIGCLIVLWMS
ncbi:MULTISPECIES: hypothetical protein [Pseudomonas]|uniref:hypothetical protein n=1 Tax=Pseudomonas TaxID=286 RepID=UPI00039F45F8|nr:MULTISPECIES: hypothetical protein [Pseudomonas]MBH3358328.1 hypothetical protein [Pseudomonas guariconensis]MCO7621997.1 hypothetical protein [Pseudomonas guariconensis]MDM9594200.1 hypothetical protein [Pseudomonas guariconensis]MDM9607027.1 hypothetical protein [Pseudomonas guariconensis]MDM9611983.1 hypothetical protein [Pseudomonas guariconensis]